MQRFTDTCHPARQLIDRMSRDRRPAAMCRHAAICVRSGEITGHLRTAYHGDNATLRTALSEVVIGAARHSGGRRLSADAASARPPRGPRCQVGRNYRGTDQRNRNFIDQTWRRVMLRNAARRYEPGLADQAAIDGLL